MPYTVVNQIENQPPAIILKKHSTVFFVQLKQKRRQFWLFICFFFSILRMLRIRIQKKIHNTGYHNILWNARGPL